MRTTLSAFAHAQAVGSFIVVPQLEWHPTTTFYQKDVLPLVAVLGASTAQARPLGAAACCSAPSDKRIAAAAADHGVV